MSNGTHGYWSDGEWVETETREEAVYKWREEHGYDPEGVYAMPGGGVVDTRGQGGGGGGEPAMPVTEAPPMPSTVPGMEGTASIIGSENAFLGPDAQPTPTTTTYTPFSMAALERGLFTLEAETPTKGDAYFTPPAVGTLDEDYRYMAGRGFNRNVETTKAVIDAFHFIAGEASIGSPGVFQSNPWEDPMMTVQIAQQTGMRPFEIRQILDAELQKARDQGVLDRGGLAPAPGGDDRFEADEETGGPLEGHPLGGTSVMGALTYAARYTGLALFGGVDPRTLEAFEGAIGVNPNTGALYVKNDNLLPIVMSPEMGYMMYGEGSEDWRVNMLGYNPEYPYNLMKKKRAPRRTWGYEYKGRRYGGGGYGRGYGGGYNYTSQTPLVMWRIGP